MKAQIWVSTVIYMLIGVSVISALLLAAMPKIKEARDRFTINYMINNFNSLDRVVMEVNEVPGVRRSFEIKIGKGTMLVDPLNDLIEWKIQTQFEFSEPNKLIKIGKVNLITLKEKSKIEVLIALNYSNQINLTTETNGEGNNLTLTAAATPYTLWLENLGNYIKTSLS